MIKGTIFSIEEFAVNDGPGIRSTVFLKGCPLRCTWCHNPEGQSPRPELMVKKGVQSICGYEITSEALAAQLKRNAEIFRMNKGGVTFTGGEPLLQHEFLVRTLELLRPEIHCALETSAYASEEVFREVIANLDLVLMDIMLPGMDGTALLCRLKNCRRLCMIPVIMLTAKGNETDKVQALDYGADDYVTKPFSIMELVSRIEYSDILVPPVHKWIPTDRVTVPASSGALPLALPPSMNTDKELNNTPYS